MESVFISQPSSKLILKANSARLVPAALLLRLSSSYSVVRAVRSEWGWSSENVVWNFIDLIILSMSKGFGFLTDSALKIVRVHRQML